MATWALRPDTSSPLPEQTKSSSSFVQGPSFSRVLAGGARTRQEGGVASTARPAPKTPRLSSDVTGQPAGAILKVESPVPAAAAAVAVLAAAAAAAAAAVSTAREGARDGTPLCEPHHPADRSARAASFPPRSPSPPPSGAIRLHPRPRSPHPQVWGLSPGRGDPDEPGRVTICSATWQVKEKRPLGG